MREIPVLTACRIFGRCRPVAVAGTLVLAGLCALAAGLIWPSPAFAHGGQFLPPPPPVGPPPPPKIPVLPPTTPTPQVPSGPVTPPSVAPPVTTPSGPQATPPTFGPGTRPRPRTPASDPNSAWQTWWVLNRWAYLPDRDAVLSRAALTPRGDDDPRFWVRRRAEAARTQVVPFLLDLLQPEAKERDDLRGSALLALGRTSQEPAVIDLLLQHLRDPKEAVLVRESAAMAAGLLRRSEPELQLDGAVLDRLRDALLDAAADASIPVRARAFCVLSVGLLADQPYGSPYSQDGRLVVRALWQRLGHPYARRDVPIALFVALGLQPVRGVPDGVKSGLREIVAGKRVHRRRWDSIERGHALSTVLRLEGADAHALLLRVLRRPREHRDAKRAAYVALGHLAARVGATDRLEVARVVLESLRRDRDALTRGLGHLALGHLLRADLADGEDAVLASTAAGRLLLAEARSGPTPSRGFSILALGLAAGSTPLTSRVVESFRTEATDVLVRELDRRATSDDLKSAFAVAAGLARLTAARAPLLKILADRSASPALRGHAAVTLAWIGPSSAELTRLLHGAVTEVRGPELQRQAALALALLGGRSAAAQLLRQMHEGKTELLLAQVVVALGRLGELSTLGALKEVAADTKRAELARALAVVALGLLTDPETRPSLLRLTGNAYYPARTAALDEAYSIL